ncbi:unnamed protein product [Discosporangium mesarthrocarpum]
MTKTITAMGLSSILATSGAFQPSIFLGPSSWGGPVVLSSSGKGGMSPMSMSGFELSPWRDLARLESRFSPGRFGRGTLLPSRRLLTEPEVVQTPIDYKLIFGIPEGSSQDDVDISVTDRVFTIKSKAKTLKGGWVGEQSLARSFVLPEGVSTDGVSASWAPEVGKVEVKFLKSGSAKPVEDESTSDKSTKVAGKVPASGSTDYLSGLAAKGKQESPDVSTKAVESVKESDTTKIEVKSETVPEKQDQQQERQPRTWIEAIDQEFEDMEKRFGGMDGSPFGFLGLRGMRFPTVEELAEQQKEARAERARQITSMRRASMVAEFSENAEGHVIRVELPEGATRDSVQLSLLPGGTLLKISYVPPEGSNPRSRLTARTLRLPRDADVTAITAQFEAEGNTGAGDEEVEGATAKGGVSALEVTVPKAECPEPRQIKIH